MTLLIIKVILPAVAAFAVGVALTPLVTHYLYRHRLWKKKAGKAAGYGGGETPIFNQLHKEKDTGTPRMGGVIIWASVFITTGIFVLAGHVGIPHFAELDFFSRSQTWLPLFALAVGALVGLLDDLLVVRGSGSHFAGGLSLGARLGVVAGVALFAAWWFYAKLEVSAVSIPFGGEFALGALFIPFFVLVALSIYASGVIDGIDGLSGGVFASIFAAYGAIAFSQQQYDIAALSAVFVGGILAFLWFNIPPARFYMTETGIMGLTMALTVIVFMTDTLGGGEGVLLLPVIGFLLVATVLSDVVQIASKRLFKRKVLKVAPLHHHFEAVGWPGYKVTMRYWIISLVLAAFGIMLAVVA